MASSTAPSGTGEPTFQLDQLPRAIKSKPKTNPERALAEIAAQLQAAPPNQNTASTTSPISCPICGKHFNRTCSLSRHSRTHASDRPISCPKCTQTFRIQTELRRHLTDKHHQSSRRRYYCPDCPSIFQYKGYLSKHRQAVHAEQLAVACHLCDRRFEWQSELIKHRSNSHREYLLEVVEALRTAPASGQN